MKISTPRFDFPLGTEVTVHGNKLSVEEVSAHGYHLVDRDTGQVSTMSFATCLDILKLPGCSIDVGAPQTGGRLNNRLGGFATAQSLPKHQRDAANFNFALCRGLVALRTELRTRTGNSSLRLSIRALDQPANRKFVQKVAQELFGAPIVLDAPRGGRRTVWAMPRGRTLLKHLQAFEQLHASESPLDALVPLDHLRGNRTPRLPHRTKELMTRAWEEVGLDTKCPALADVHRRLEELIAEENAVRLRNGLKKLVVPSSSSLRDHRDKVVTELELLVATKGERQARNSRGRGSTDLRALVVGEYIELDECMASLVVSAKAKGLWERLSTDTRARLEEIDTIIRERLTILVMFDLATRMPLAWVISDQPRAQATLALFRMATRDKTREKRIYGCEGDPMPAIGLGHVVNDNGPGLRNSLAVTALLGMGAMNTIGRTFAATDKPYIERMFGTQESVLLKLLHGYTGRKPGDLPGYDAVANGVLDVEELYGILTKFMIDEYPSMRHSGVGMGMRRPIEVYNEINQTRGCFAPIDPNWRRRHLGFQQSVTPTDEGVRVLKTLWFNSDELQRHLARMPRTGKVDVFFDPDDLNAATVLLPRVEEPVEVRLQITAFADMTAAEVLELLATWRKEDPRATELYEDRIRRVRRERRDQLRVIGVERKLKRSFSTLEELEAKARNVMAGARIVPSQPLPGTTPPGSITDLSGDRAVAYPTGRPSMLMEGHAVTRGDTPTEGAAAPVPFGQDGEAEESELGSVTNLACSPAIPLRAGHPDMVMDGHDIPLDEGSTEISAPPLSAPEDRRAAREPHVHGPAARPEKPSPSRPQGSGPPALGRPSTIKRLE